MAICQLDIQGFSSSCFAPALALNVNTMIEKVIKVPGHKDPVHLKFSCGKCIVGHRTAKCNHYTEFLEGKKETTHRERFYLIKKNGKKPNRPVAFLFLQVIPKKFTINDSETPRCKYAPEKYSFECKQSCCDGKRKMCVNEFVDLQVRHTELDMVLFKNVDPIPLVGSKAAREAYRLWHFLSHMDWYLESGIDALQLPRVFSLDDKESWGTNITSLVRDLYGFDAVAATAHIPEGKTPTKFKQCLKSTGIVADEINDVSVQESLAEVGTQRKEEDYQLLGGKCDGGNWLELDAFPIPCDSQQCASTELNANSSTELNASIQMGIEQAVQSTRLINHSFFKDMSLQNKRFELDDEAGNNDKENGNMTAKQAHRQDFDDDQAANIVPNQSFNKAMGHRQIEAQIFLFQQGSLPTKPIQLDATLHRQALKAQVLMLPSSFEYPQADDSQQINQFQQPMALYEQMSSRPVQKQSQLEQNNVDVQQQLLNQDFNPIDKALEDPEWPIMKALPGLTQDITEEHPFGNIDPTLLGDLQSEQTMNHYSGKNETLLGPLVPAKTTAENRSAAAVDIQCNAEPISDFPSDSFFSFNDMAQLGFNAYGSANNEADTIGDIYAQIFNNDPNPNN
jgi:hypothetical protein